MLFKEIMLNSIAQMRFYYLGGGTALALQLGHRISEDLDFFVAEEFDHLSYFFTVVTYKRKAMLTHPQDLSLLHQASVKVSLEGIDRAFIAF